MFGKKVKFDNAVKMLEYIRDGHDLYSPKECVYVFVYSLKGSICHYDNISNEKAMELCNDAKEDNGYWGGFLGIGGNICDPVDYHGITNLQWCEDMYQVSDWEDVTEEEK